MGGGSSDEGRGVTAQRQRGAVGRRARRPPACGDRGRRPKQVTALRVAPTSRGVPPPERRRRHSGHQWRRTKCSSSAHRPAVGKYTRAPHPTSSGGRGAHAPPRRAGDRSATRRPRQRERSLWAPPRGGCNNNGPRGAPTHARAAAHSHKGRAGAATRRRRRRQRRGTAGPPPAGYGGTPIGGVRRDPRRWRSATRARARAPPAGAAPRRSDAAGAGAAPPCAHGGCDERGTTGVPAPRHGGAGGAAAGG